MSYKTAVQVDSDVRQYLFSAKERPGESFNAAIRRELGMDTPADTDADAAEESTDTDADAAEEPTV